MNRDPGEQSQPYEWPGGSPSSSSACQPHLWGILLVVAVVFIATDFERVGAFIFGFIGLVQVVVGALFYWSQRE